MFGARLRSIPAHAGEPTARRQSDSRRAVYPRPRGGTLHPNGMRGRPRGLSPPTRGNPISAILSPPCPWSIPAHAGEPSASGFGVPASGVYPRPRGGTTPTRPSWILTSGLSPPTRGNPQLRDYQQDMPRSIPAHAGEPPRPTEPADLPAVYPRPRGGTPSTHRDTAPVWGLSPPTRGNHHALSVRLFALGSIPAHAGEPSSSRTLTRAKSVYPRPRGGTARARENDCSPRGLSPPTRGNLTRRKNGL